MQVIQVGEGKYEVKQVHTVEAGRQFQISPTRGMLGVDDGIIEVEGVYTWDELQQHEQWRTLGDPEVLVEIDHTLTTEHWVVYYYPRDPHNQGSYFAFPMSMFIDHISAW